MTPLTPRGTLGPLQGGYNGDALVHLDADVDLSGSQSIIGRSLVLTVTHRAADHYSEAQSVRVACCTIGLAAPEKKAAQPQPRRRGQGIQYREAQQPAYQPSGYSYGGAW